MAILQKLLFISFSFFIQPTLDILPITQEFEYPGTAIQIQSQCLIYLQNEYVIVFANQTSVILENASNPVLIEEDNRVVVFYHKWKRLWMNVYTYEGVLQYNKEVHENPIDSDFVVVCENNQYIIGGSVSEYSASDFIALRSQKELEKKDGLIMVLSKNGEVNDCYLYGGKENERILDIVKWNTEWVLIVQKFGISGGDFGYAGSYKEVIVVATLNEDFSIRNYVTLANVEKANTITIYNNRLYVSYAFGLYVFLNNLSIENHYVLENAIEFMLFTEQNKWLIYVNGSFYSYCIETMVLDWEVPYFLEEEEVIKRVGNALYLSTSRILLDIIDLRNSKIPPYYLPDNDIIWNATSLFGLVIDKKTSSEYLFQPQIHGIYPVCYEFTTAAGMVKKIEMEIINPLYTNVKEGGIYPVGYPLTFSGYATLNQQSIASNYRLMQPGTYTLELTSVNGTKEKFVFEVSTNQYNFQMQATINHTYLYQQVYKNEEYNIVLPFELPNNYDIVSVVIDGVSNSRFRYDEEKKVLEVTMIAPSTLGEHVVFVEQIIFHVNQIELTKNIAMYYPIGVIAGTPSIMIENSKEGYGIRLHIQDNEKSLQYLEACLESNNQIRNVRFPIGSQDIVLNNLDVNKQVTVTFRIAYDTGYMVEYSNIFYQVTFTPKQNQVRMGTIVIIQQQQFVEQLEIETYHKDTTFELQEIRSGSIVLYRDYPSGIPSILWIPLGILFGVGCTVVGMYVTRKKQQKRPPTISL